MKVEQWVSDGVSLPRMALMLGRSESAISQKFKMRKGRSRVSKAFNNIHWVLREIELMRLERAISQTSLAMLAGYSAHSWRKYMRADGTGNSVRTLHTIERYLKVFGKKLAIVEESKDDDGIAD